MLSKDEKTIYSLMWYKARCINCPHNLVPEDHYTVCKPCVDEMLSKIEKGEKFDERAD